VRRAAGAILAAALTLTGCFPGPNPSPSPSPSPSPASTPDASDAEALRFAIAAEPSGFVPPALDPDTARIQHFLYDALYRLDERLRPQPDLAAGQPAVSDDGLTWTVGLRSRVTFSDGGDLSAADVVTTFRLALSPACPFDALCPIAQAHLAGVSADADGNVVLKLRAPFSSLQSELLAALPILSDSALTASLERLVAGAASVDLAAAATTVERIADATSAEACLVPSPPLGCDPADHVAELTSLLASAGVAPPQPLRYLDDAGEVDRSAYGTALLGAARDLVAALSTSGTDQLAAALSVLDLAAAPVGTGAYRLARYRPGVLVELERRTPLKKGQPAVIRAVVERDPTAAATALLSGQLDWLPDVAPQLVSILSADPGVRVAARPGGTLRALVFNVRSGHVFADLAVRQAISRCLDRAALVAGATNGAGLPAASLVAPVSWAYAPPRSAATDPAVARRLLESAGYQAAADGIYARAGERLSAELLVRPGSTDLAALAAATSVELRGCGIELAVRQVDFTSELILTQLEWPNDFDVFLATVRTGSDPDVDLGWLGSGHVTGPVNPGDANFGGWSDPATDWLLAEGEGTLSTLRRAATYRELQAHLAAGSPVLPLVHDIAYGAVSARLATGDGPVDPALMTYELGIDGWILAAP
jgi:ABC-type transport system substrate-binding protein